MKKTFISLLLAGSSLALFAQTSGTDSTGKTNTPVSNTNATYNSGNTGDSLNHNNSNSNQNNLHSMNNSSNANLNSNTTNASASSSMSSGNYNAYGTQSTNAPANIQTNFQKDYPSASNVKWDQNNNWWHANYMFNGRSMNTYYGLNGTSYNISLPVIEDLVPADVVTMVENKYPNVYDITQVKGNNDNYIYVVRALSGNQLMTYRLNADGSEASDINNNNQGSLNTKSSTDNTENANTTTNSSTSTEMSTKDNSSSSTMTTTTSDDSSSSGKKAKNKSKTKYTTTDGVKHIIKTKNGKTYTKTSTGQQDQQ